MCEKSVTVLGRYNDKLPFQFVIGCACLRRSLVRCSASCLDNLKQYKTLKSFELQSLTSVMKS